MQFKTKSDVPAFTLTAFWDVFVHGRLVGRIQSMVGAGQNPVLRSPDVQCLLVTDLIEDDGHKRVYQVV